MRKLLSCVLVGTLLAGAWLHAGEMLKPAGRVVLHISSTVAPGGGLTLTAAGGTLTLLDGTAHAFAVKGMASAILRARADLEEAPSELESGPAFDLSYVADAGNPYRPPRL